MRECGRGEVSFSKTSVRSFCFWLESFKMVPRGDPRDRLDYVLSFVTKTFRKASGRLWIIIMSILIQALPSELGFCQLALCWSKNVCEKTESPYGSQLF